jgi:hypothetical protein
MSGGREIAEQLGHALGASRLIRTNIERQVERYAALDRAILHATGGDRFPAAALHVVHEQCPRT